jgi:DNA-binding transcriptional ArsR family regulator
MARAATTSDASAAVVEPRRDLLNYLAMRERSVTEIVGAMEMEQPSVSRHRKVLKNVGPLEVRGEGGPADALQGECYGNPAVA